MEEESTWVDTWKRSPRGWTHGRGVHVGGHMEEESTWVDTNIFLYIQRFSKDQFDQCFRNHCVSAVFDDSDAADLTLISLRGRCVATARVSLKSNWPYQS
jgi:hypothetical protein